MSLVGVIGLREDYTRLYKKLVKRKKVIIRNANSTRPWQHVLEVIFGYLTLAANLDKNKKLHGEAFNFGPKIKSRITVIQLLKFIKKITKFMWVKKKNKFLKESKLLKLNSKKQKNY